MKNKTISRTKAIELIEENKGKFATVTFTKKNGELRTINFNRSKNGTTKLGYLRVNNIRENKFASVDPKTISALNINGLKLKVK